MGTGKVDAGCIFCQIIAGQIPSTTVSDGDDYRAIRDVNPQAPTHILIVPRDHYADVCEVEDAGLLGRLFQAAASVAKSEGLDSGFRLVVNTGAQAGQTVFHLHIHLLGGRSMHWPPG